MTKQNHQSPVNPLPSATSTNGVDLVDNSFLTEEETKKILTPFAFKIDESLFGIPLAVPWRRGLALFLDFVLIAILSSAPGELLAILVAITFYKMGSSKKHNKVGRLKRFKRISFRILGASIIFFVLVGSLPFLFEESVPDSISANDNKALNWADGIALGALSTGAYQKINASSCREVACWKTELLPFVEKLPTHSQNNETVKTLVDTMVATIDEKQKLSKESEKELEHYFFNEYLQLKGDLISKEPQEKSEADENIYPLVEAEASKKKNNENSFGYKGVEWFKGVIDDLGLGFGWAALYFTVLTSIWHGQTPGKKLFKIRVIQLDGTELSMWDSFGRYGGYGAGLATGLLGFLQIYWDPNRQAIHDKISSTIVIDVTKFEQIKRRSLEKAQSNGAL